jgi:uncharacterized protein (DUF305 family)
VRTRRITGVLAAAATAVILAACANTSSAPTEPAVSATAAPSPATADHGATDVMFLQDMIPHHAQAIAMSRQAATRAASPQVRDLAGRIERAQGPEIAQMTGLLTAWGAPVPPAARGGQPGMMPGGGAPGMPEREAPGMMSGTGGPGMMSDQQMQQMTGASAAMFDQMFLRMMTAHHQGAVSMAQSELARGRNPQTEQLARTIIGVQQAEIVEMQNLLDQR